MEPVQNGGPDIAKLEEPNDTKIRSDKGDPNIGSVENNSFPKIHLFERGIQVLKDICENEKISEGEKLKSMERKFPTILKVIVGIFTIGIGAAIMHKIEEKYSNEDLSARKEIANELAKFGHDIKRLENGESKKIEFCGVKINVIKKDSGKFLIKGRTKIISEKNNQGNLILKLESNSIEISKESLENNIAKNISLLNKENASKFVEGSMLNMAKDIDQFKKKDAAEPKRGNKESDEEYNRRKEEYHKTEEEYSKKVKRFEELANKILESSADTKLGDINTENTSKETIYRVVKRVTTEKAKSEKEVKEKFHEETLIGSNDAREIRENFENTKPKVKIEKTEKKSSEKVENAPVDSINQVNKADGNQEQNKITPQDVHNFVADIILNDDAFIHDKNVSKPGERMRQTFIKHLGTFVALLNEEISLNTLDKYFKLIMGAEMRKMRKAINKGKTINEGNAGKSNYTIDDVKNFLEKRCFEGEKGEKEYSEIFSGMEKAFDETVKNTADKMQDSLSEQLKSICGGGTNENPKILEKIKEQISNLKKLYSKEAIKEFEGQSESLPNEVREFLEEVYNDFDKIGNSCTQSKNSEYINDSLRKLTDSMHDLLYARRARKEDETDESLIKEGKAIFLDIKRCLLEDKLENALSYLEKMEKTLMVLKVKN